MKKIVAIHQPNFLPWKGFFDKMAECDVFVLLDDVQFTKGSYINRTKAQVKGRLEYQWLTIPVHYHYLQNINEVEIVDYWTVRKMVENFLYQNYPKSFDLIKPVFNAPRRMLSELNIALIAEIKSYFEIKTEIVLSSTLEYSKGKTANLVDIIGCLDGTVYLSGAGGSSKYLDLQQFKDAGIEVVLKDYSLQSDPGTALKYIEDENN